MQTTQFIIQLLSGLEIKHFERITLIKILQSHFAIFYGLSIYIYIYIYIERERERESKERKGIKYNVLSCYVSSILEFNTRQITRI